MNLIPNTGQLLDFKQSYIVTANWRLLFDNYNDYKNALNEINQIEFSDGQVLAYDDERNEFYATIEI